MISEDYCENWAPVMAIRELISNALDTGTVPNIRYEGKTCTIEDNGPGFDPVALLIGESHKNNNQIGQFGEGLKIGALVLSRMGRKISVRSNGNEYIFRVDGQNDFGKKLLVVDIHSELPPIKGTKVKFECCEDELNEAKNMFLVFKKDYKFNTDKNFFNLPGEIYVTGVFTRKLSALFGYNINSKELVNRDRTMIDEDAIAQGITSKLDKTKDREVILKYLTSKNNNYLEYRNRCFPLHKSLWENLAREAFGKKCCLSSQKGNDRAEYLGYRVLMDLPWAVATVLAYLGIPCANTVQNKSDKCQQVGAAHLTLRERRSLDAAKRVARKVAPSKTYKIKVVSRFDDLSVRGEREGNIIRISRKVLAAPEQAIATTLHELAHWASRSQDCSSSFEAQLTEFLGILGARTVRIK